MAEEPFNYRSAIEKIDGIMHRLENEEPDIDQLSNMVKEASVLIKACKQKLKSTEEDLEKTIGGMEED